MCTHACVHMHVLYVEGTCIGVYCLNVLLSEYALGRSLTFTDAHTYYSITLLNPRETS